MQFYLNYIREAQSIGVEVYSGHFNFHHRNFDPTRMTDLSGVIEDNIKPIKRSSYRQRYKQMYDFYEASMKSVNVPLIDLADNLCYDDICDVISPEGYAIYTDAHHYCKFYSRHWLSVVDHLTEF
jgi:hypothetical protein